MEQTAGPAVRQSILTLQGRSCAVDSASVGYDSVIIPAPDISKSYDMIAASYVPGTVRMIVLYRTVVYVTISLLFFTHTVPYVP